MQVPPPLFKNKLPDVLMNASSFILGHVCFLIPSVLDFGLWTKCLHFEELLFSHQWHLSLFLAPLWPAFYSSWLVRPEGFALGTFLNFPIRSQLHGQVLMFTVGESCFASLSAKRKTFAILVLTIGCCLGDYQSKIDRDKISLLRFIHSFICCEFTNLLLQTHYA